MQSVSHTAVTARAPPPPPPRALCSARPRTSRAAGSGAPTTVLRARCGGAVEPVEARDQDGCAPGEEEGEVLAPEELEMLEDEAMGGGDEDRRPTDYDRRAHIFEASSRVFRALKQRRDCDGGVEATTAVAAAAAAGETARDRHEPQRLE